MTIEEIERMLEEADIDSIKFHTVHCVDIIHQLLAERSQLRRKAFEEAADYVFKNNSMNTCVCDCPMGIVKALRRKAEQEIGNSVRVANNDPNDISG